jgi:hypothetical protein
LTVSSSALAHLSHVLGRLHRIERFSIKWTSPFKHLFVLLVPSFLPSRTTENDATERNQNQNSTQ